MGQVSRASASLSAEAYAVVRQRIILGEVALGQSLSRRKLAAELGMSFLPISEALLRLECEGLLESRPRAGTRVPIPSRETVLGHFVVREALEVQAASMFAVVATSEERRELRQLAARVDRVSTGSDRALYVELHQKFHFRIAEGARCRALVEAIERTHALASTWSCAKQIGPAREVPARHEELAVDVGSGDLIRATEAVRRHLAFGRRHAFQLLEPYFSVRSSREEHYFRGVSDPET